MMGSSNTTPHYNAFQKARLGWLNAGVSPPLTSVQGGASGQYTIEPMENARDTVSRALKIPMSSSCASTQQYYYVEQRQASGVDSFLSGNSNVLTGVLVHTVANGDPNGSYLLDMTAATGSWSDAALDAGITYTDPVAGLTIMPVSVGSSATTVSVTFPPSSCTRAAPTVTATPSGTQWTSDGATVNYSVSVTNNDSCGCPSSTFDVSDAVQSGWSATSARSASIPPGSSTSAGTLVTTASSAAAGFYPVTMKASNSSAPTISASAGGTVAVVTSLGVGVVADKASYVRPTRGNGSVTAKITTTVNNGTSPLSGAAVSVQVKDPGGIVTTLSGTTGSTGTVAVSYTIKKTNLAGTYTVTSTATIGAMSNKATTTFALQ